MGYTPIVLVLGVAKLAFKDPAKLLYIAFNASGMQQH